MNQTTHLFWLFVESAGSQRDASGTGTRDSLISHSPSSEISSDARRTVNMDSHGRREEGGRKARKGCTCRIIGVHEGAMPTDASV